MSSSFKPCVVSVLVCLTGLTAIPRNWAGITNVTPIRTFAMRTHAFDVSFSPDGTAVLTAGAYGEAVLWDPATGEKRVTFQGMDPTSTNRSTATFSGDGRYILTAQADHRSALLWDATTNRMRRAFTTLLANVGVYDAAISSNAARVATCERGTNTVRIWDGATGQLLITLYGHTQGALSCAFSPEGTTLATGGNPIGAMSPVHLWNLATWQTRLTIPHHDQVHSVAYSQDGTRLVTVDRQGTPSEGTAELWQAATGLKLGQFAHGSATVLAATISPDGNQVLTGSRDGCARLWDCTSGELVCTFWSEAGQGSDVPAVAFSPDGQRILTAHVAGFAAMWEVPQQVSLGATRTVAGGVLLTWLAAAQEAGFVLQQCPDLLQGNWIEVAVSEPGRYEIQTPSGAGSFFRLVKF